MKDERIDWLQDLKVHRGWLMLKDALDKRANHAMSQMRQAKSTDELLKHTYTYMALSDLSAAPDVLLNVLTSPNK